MNTRVCYSAQLRAEHAEFTRRLGAKISIDEFAKKYGHRVVDASVKIPRAIDQWFAKDPKIEPQIGQYKRDKMAAWSAELDKQGARLTAANHALEEKPTKRAETNQRVAAKKIKQLRRWIADLERVELKPEDARIYPHWFAPVMIWEDGERVVKPMRYGCRPAGKPSSYDSRYPGTYNARRDNLEGFWKGQFGISHGIMLATAFFENVSRHKLEGRELAEGETDENVVIKFEPNTGETMFVACLWSRWTGKEGNLLSFATITDDPPIEVASAGHDRCIIPIQGQNIDAWLRPQGDLARSYSILDDRERPYYEHEVAKAA